MSARPIKVLVVEDSPTARTLLTYLLESDPALKVVGTAHDGADALAAIMKWQPDVITMDIHMPGMDGYETTRRIMQTQPLPIVIVSASYDPADVENSFRAMEAGAVAAIEKPPGVGHPDHDLLARKLVTTVRAMSEVRVIRRWPKGRPAAPVPPPELPRNPALKVVAIGASTGGPPVLQTILRGLTAPCPVPILIVQHISAGFVQGLADWLEKTTGHAVRLAAHNDRALAGHVYLAPDDCQMRLERTGRISCVAEPTENGLRPSVSFLFRALASSFGPAALGVLLTGMGRDGADELRLLRDQGAITIAQDKESSIVHGMPGEAIKLDGATYIFSPERIAATIQALVVPPATS